MDVLTFMIDTLRAELGEDIFTDARRARFELAIRQQVGNESHYIASAAALQRIERNAAIVRHLMAGNSVATAAERFGLTDRQIRSVRQQAIDSGAYKNGTACP